MLQSKGIAIHGIGHQAHYSVDRAPVAELEATILEVAAAGLRNHVTELDISLHPHMDAEVPALGDALKARQGLGRRPLDGRFRRLHRTREGRHRRR